MVVDQPSADVWCVRQATARSSVINHYTTIAAEFARLVELAAGDARHHQGAAVTIRALDVRLGQRVDCVPGVASR